MLLLLDCQNALLLCIIYETLKSGIKKSQNTQTPALAAVYTKIVNDRLSDRSDMVIDMYKRYCMWIDLKI